jgi:multidrug transporter EmrE-like cation transporter
MIRSFFPIMRLSGSSIKHSSETTGTDIHLHVTRIIILMLSILEILSLIFVGATWGCSNSFLRKGSTEAAKLSTPTTATTTTIGTQQATAQQQQPHLSHDERKSTWLNFLKKELSKFRHISVWLPYVVNQSGSILYYVTLSQTDISIAVPVCNALSLVFSIWTSWFVLKEPIERPILTMIGAAFVMVGVAVCIQAAEPR